MRIQSVKVSSVADIHRLRPGAEMQIVGGGGAVNPSDATAFSPIALSSEESEKVPNPDDVSRAELTALLAAIEARMETQVTRIEAKLDLSAESSRTAAEAALSMSKDAKQAALDTAKEVREGNRSERFWMIGTAVAVVAALWSVNQSFIGNTIMAFESGKTTATAIQQATDQQKAIADQQRELADQQRKFMETMAARLQPSVAAAASAPSASK